jgi:lysophospholipase L1-like esterase
MKKIRFSVIWGLLVVVLTLTGCATQKPQTQAGWDGDSQSILFYGDSITWGYVPFADSATWDRYPFNVRWTGVIQKELGPGYTVIEEGLNSRTAGVDEFPALDPPIERDLNLNGRPSFLPIIRSHEPLALIVIILGANDVRPYHNQTLDDIKASVTHLVKIAKLGPRLTQPKILLVAPPPLGPGQNEGLNKLFNGGYELSARLADAFGEIALAENIEFFDAGAAASVLDTLDGIHFDEEGNKRFGLALAAKIREILP